MVCSLVCVVGFCVCVFVTWEIKRKACVLHWADLLRDRMCDVKMVPRNRVSGDQGTCQLATGRSSSQLVPRRDLVCVRHRPMAGYSVFLPGSDQPLKQYAFVSRLHSVSICYSKKYVLFFRDFSFSPCLRNGGHIRRVSWTIFLELAGLPPKKTSDDPS